MEKSPSTLPSLPLWVVTPVFAPCPALPAQHSTDGMCSCSRGAHCPSLPVPPHWWASFWEVILGTIPEFKVWVDILGVLVQKPGLA